MSSIGPVHLNKAFQILATTKYIENFSFHRMFTAIKQSPETKMTKKTHLTTTTCNEQPSESWNSKPENHRNATISSYGIADPQNSKPNFWPTRKATFYQNIESEQRKTEK